MGHLPTPENWGPNLRMAETKDLDKQNMFMIFREKKRPKWGIHFLIASIEELSTGMEDSPGARAGKKDALTSS